MKMCEIRLRTNDELLHLREGEDLVKFSKAQRLRWVGHVLRMPEQRQQRAILSYTPYNTKSTGRPRLRWLDDVIADVRKLGIENWIDVAKDKAKWRKIVDEAKAYPEL